MVFVFVFAFVLVFVLVLVLSWSCPGLPLDVFQKFNTDEKEIASQVVLEEGGVQNKDMMLRAPEAVPKKCALPQTHT